MKSWDSLEAKIICSHCRLDPLEVGVCSLPLFWSLCGYSERLLSHKNNVNLLIRSGAPFHLRRFWFILLWCCFLKFLRKLWFKERVGGCGRNHSEHPLRPRSSTALIAECDVIWYGKSLWPVWVSCPSCVPSQLLVHPQPPCWWERVRSRKGLDTV